MEFSITVNKRRPRKRDINKTFISQLAIKTISFGEINTLMIETILLLLAVYTFLLLVVNVALGPGISVKVILWLQILYIRIVKSSFKLKIGSVALTVHPFELFGWNRENNFGGSLLKLNISNIALSLDSTQKEHNNNQHSSKTYQSDTQSKDNDNDQKVDISTSLTEKLQKVLLTISRFCWLLPLEVSIRNFALQNGDNYLKMHALSFYFNGAKHTKKDSTKHIILSSQLEISQISVNDSSVLNNLKINVQLDSPLNSKKLTLENVSLSMNINGLDADVDLLSKLLLNSKLSKKNSASRKNIEFKSSQTDLKRKNTLIDIIKATKLSSVSVSADRIFVKQNGIACLSDGFFFGIDSKCPELQRLLTTNLHKVAISIASLTVNPIAFPKLKLQMNFINFASLIDIRKTIFALGHINEQDYGKHISKEDPFLVSSFFTITNFSVSASLDDFLLMQRNGINGKANSHNSAVSTSEEVNYSKTNSGVKLMSDYRRSNIILLARKIRMKLQVLSFAFNFTLGDNFRIELVIDDLRLDSLASEGPTLFEPDTNYLMMKPMTLVSKSIQARIIEENERTTKIVELDKFDILGTISVGRDSFYFDEMKVDINQTEVLFQDVQMLKKMAHILKNRKTRLEKDSESYTLNKSSEILIPDAPKSIPFSVIRHLKFHLGKIKFAACFENPIGYFNDISQSEMNKYIRGYSFHIHDTGFNLDFDSNQRDFTFDYYISSAGFYLIRDFTNERKQQSFPRFLLVNSFTCDYNTSKNSLEIRLPKLDGNISIEVIWSVMFATKILTQAFFSDSGKDISTTTKTNDEEKRDFPRILLRLDFIMMKLKLPSDIDLAIELDSLSITNTTAGFKAFRIYAVNPHSTEYWSPMVIFTHGNINYSNYKNDEPIDISFCSSRLEIPFEYVFYQTFDNARAFHKAINQIRLMFKDILFIDPNDKQFSIPIIPPSKVDKPPKIPKLRIRSKLFKFCMHDDPFEVQFTKCLLMGKVEQKIRLAKLSAFEKYREKIERKLEERYTSLEFEDGHAKVPDVYKKVERGGDGTYSTFCGIEKKMQSKSEKGSHLVNEISEDAFDEYTSYLKDYHQFIEIPKSRLLSNLSESWILRVINGENIATAKESDVSSDPRVRKEFLDKYPVMVAGDTTPLFSLSIKDLELNLEQPSFGLNNYPDFLYEVGGQTPKDSEYGILFPVHLDLFSSSVEVQLKDYPLPILAFGGGPSDKCGAIRITGDLVIAEQMYTFDEMRYNFVPFVSQYDDPQRTDNLYAFHVSRTMTNVKFISKLNTIVNSKRPAVICWASAIQPALTCMMNSFDVLSKPPIDLSPSIGFWDKIPLLFHTKWTFDCKNGIDLFIKAGASPYDYLGEAAGFLFRWSQNAILKINSTGKSEDFLRIESGEFEMDIPSFHLSSTTNILLFQGEVRDSYSVLKTVIKLCSKPVIWSLGFSFERNIDPKTKRHAGFVPRTKKFKPHYLVRLKNPITFKNESEKKLHDSYSGWRSDYIHMAVCVKSKGGSFTHNSAHLTPLTFSRFFRWWDTFHESLGLPIKGGKLFSNGKLISSKLKSPKFGQHLFSISYQIDLSAVNLAHIYRHAVDLRANSKVSFTGLKCLLDNLLVDIHQSKRGRVVLDENMLEMGQALSLRMTKGIIDFEGAELRIVNSEFNETSPAGMLAKEIGLQNNESSDASFDDASSISYSTISQDSCFNDWFDQNDFIELDTPTVHEEIPKWKAIKMAFTPRFYYVRDLGNSSFEYPFDEVQMHTHPCQIDKRSFSQEPTKIADTRLAQIRQLLDIKKSILRKEPKSKSVQSQIKQLEEKISKIILLKGNFKDGIFPRFKDLDNKKTENDVEKELSRCISSTSSYVAKSIATTGTISPVHPSTYKNRFIIYNIEAVWDTRTKNLFLNYIDRVTDRRSLVFSLSHKAVKLAQDLSTKLEMDKQNMPEGEGYESELQSSTALIEGFDQMLHDISMIESGRAEDTYLLKFIYPQFRVSGTDNVCLLAMANQIVARNVEIESAGYSAGYIDLGVPVESRWGLTVSELNLYVLERQKALNNQYQIYSSSDHIWPPSLPFEMYYSSESLKDATVIWNLTCGMLVNNPNELHIGNVGGHDNNVLKENIRVAAPMVRLRANSKQYAAILDCALSLIKYQKTESQKLKGVVKKLVKFSDIGDLNQVARYIEYLQQKIRQLERCKETMRICDENSYRNNNTTISVELERDFLHLNALAGYLQEIKSVRYNDSYDMRRLLLTAFNIEVQLLTDDGEPFLDLIAVDSFYSTMQRPDGASQNQVCIYDFVAKDNYPTAKYKTIISRLEDGEEPLCFVDWSLLPPVGGITIMQKRTIDFAPIRLQIDYRLAKKIYNFIFPNSCVKVKSASIISSSSDDDDVVDDLFETMSAETELSDDSTDAASIQSSIASTNLSTSSVNDSGNVHRSLGKILSRSSARSESSASVNSRNVTKRSSKIIRKDTFRTDDNYAEMERRSNLYMLGNVIMINPMKLCLTFKGKGALRLINVSNMILDIPKIEFGNALISNEEFLAVLRIKILKIALKNIPRFIQSKFKNDDAHNVIQGEVAPASVNADTIIDDSKIHPSLNSITRTKSTRSRFLDPDLLGPGVERLKKTGSRQSTSKKSYQSSL